MLDLFWSVQAKASGRSCNWSSQGDIACCRHPVVARSARLPGSCTTQTRISALHGRQEALSSQYRCNREFPVSWTRDAQQPGAYGYGDRDVPPDGTRVGGHHLGFDSVSDPSPCCLGVYLGAQAIGTIPPPRVAAETSRCSPVRSCSKTVQVEPENVELGCHSHRFVSTSCSS